MVTNFLEAEELMDEANLEAILYMACFPRNYFKHIQIHKMENGFLSASAASSSASGFTEHE